MFTIKSKTKLYMTDEDFKVKGKGDIVTSYEPDLLLYASQFEYGVPFDAALVSYNESGKVDLSIPFWMTIDDDGMICFEAKPIDGDFDPDDKQVSLEDQMVTRLRNRLRGVYYFMRYVFVFERDRMLPLDNIAAPSKDYKDNHGDDYLTITVAETKCEGVHDVLNNMMVVMEECLDDASKSGFALGSEGPLGMALALSLYGTNLVNLERTLLNGDYNGYKNSFKIFHSLAESRHQAYERTLQFRYSRKANKISRRGLILSAIGIWMSFLAGSILCDVITGEHSDQSFQIFVLMVTIASAILIVAVIIAVYCREYDECKEHSAHDDVASLLPEGPQ